SPAARNRGGSRGLDGGRGAHRGGRAPSNGSIVSRRSSKTCGCLLVKGGVRSAIGSLLSLHHHSGAARMLVAESLDRQSRIERLSIERRLGSVRDGLVVNSGCAKDASISHL